MTQPFDDRTMGLIRRGVATLTLMVGLTAVVFGVYWLKRRNDFLATAATADGRVVANRREEWTSRSSGAMGPSRHAYRAIVLFTDRTGHHVMHPDFLAFNPSSFSIGQTVKVFYDPNASDTVWIDRGGKELYLLLAISALGTLLLASGVRALFKVH
jgi:Protein of unknown function (DUF3592)